MALNCLCFVFAFSSRAGFFSIYLEVDERSFAVPTVLDFYFLSIARTLDHFHEALARAKSDDPYLTPRRRTMDRQVGGIIWDYIVMF